MSYNKFKTLKKSVDAPLFVVGLSYLAIMIMKRNNVEVTEEVTATIGASATGIYGMFRGLRNWLKHRRNR